MESKKKKKKTGKKEKPTRRTKKKKKDNQKKKKRKRDTLFDYDTRKEKKKEKQYVKKKKKNKTDEPAQGPYIKDPRISFMALLYENEKKRKKKRLGFASKTEKLRKVSVSLLVSVYMPVKAKTAPRRCTLSFYFLFFFSPRIRFPSTLLPFLLLLYYQSVCRTQLKGKQTGTQTRS